MDVTRIDIVPGELLVLPLAGPPGGERTARFSDGTTAPFTVHRIAVRPVMQTDEADVWARWLPAPVVWTVQSEQEGLADAGFGTWVAVLRGPRECAATTMTIFGRSHNVQWLPGVDAKFAAEASELAGPTPGFAAIENGQNPMLATALKRESSTPLGRWRIMLGQGLRQGNAPGREAFDNPVLEAIARQNEHRWRVALAWVWAADAQVAEKLRARLTMVADFGGGVLAPAWPSDFASLDALLGDLLDPDARPMTRAMAAERWLRAQPPATAWVMDDGGVLDANLTTVVAQVGVVNLTDEPTVCWVSVGSTGPGTEPSPLPGGVVRTLALPVPAPPASETVGVAPSRRLIASAAGWRKELPVLAGRLRPSPPGLVIGPFVRDWDMRSWLEGSTMPVRPEWTTGALLMRAAPTPGREARWELLVECRRVPGIGTPELERVKMTFGPPTAAASVVNVSMSGELTNEIVERELGALRDVAPQTIEVVSTPEKWSFRVSVPPGAFEKGGTLRMSLERRDALGRRTSWPRAMLPWQQQPARAPVSTGAWDGFEEEGA